MTPQWNADIITPEEKGSGTQVIGDNQQVQTTLESGDNITIEDGKISATGDLENVQADWTQSDSEDPSYIKHKPTLATVATSGDYSDLSNRPDLSVYATTSEVADKADKVSDAVSGNLAGFDSNGNLADSGIAAANLVHDASYVHTDNNFSNADVTKLSGIEAGAEVNVQANWSQSDSSADDFVKNKPDLSVYAQSANLATVATSGSYDDLSDKPTIPAAVTVDQTYSASSQNAQSGVAVASAISGKQDTISDLATIRSGAEDGATAVQPGDLATVATTGAYSDLSGVPTIPVVDQTYSAASTNAQSGVAVAEAIAGISVDEVPVVTSSDDGKVLTASYSGGAGSYSWETASSGSTYTASAPISIESDVIKLKYTNDFALNWKWKPVMVTGFDGVTTGMSYSGLVTKCQVSSMSPNYSPFTQYYKFVLTVWNISWSGAYIDTSSTTTKWTIVLYKQGSPDTDYAIATETYDYASVSGNRHYMFDGVTSSFTFSFTNANIHGNLSNTPLCLAFIPDPADNVTGTSYWNTPRAVLYGAGYSSFYTPTVPVDYNIAPTPGPTPIDTLSIQSLPDTVVDQTFSATSKKAQSGVAVAGALATIKQVPASTSADSTKVLTVNSIGTPVWADAADVDVDQDNVVLTGDGDSVKMEFTRVTDTSTQYVGEVTLTSDTTVNSDSYLEVFLVFDLDSGYKGYESGFSPKVHISNALTGLGGSYLYGGFSDTTINSSLGIIAFVNGGTVAAQDKSINGTNNQRRYYLIGAISPNGPSGFDAIAAQLKASVSITGWPCDVYGTKVVIPVVDQTYSSSSTNAQSGTAVAEAISGISVDEVPAVTSSDDAKVLTATYSGGVGSYAWAAAQGGTSYTAGDGIDITNDTISADVDGTTIGIDSTTKKIKLLSAIPTVDQTYSASSTNAQSGVAVASAISTKQDTISDLATIRTGAGLGATAVQPSSLATVATSGSYNDLSDKPSIPAAQVNSDWNSSSGVSQILNKPTLATVATTGDYNDLSNKPSIPAAVTVDQTYNASSTNAQSGTAVAGALAAVPTKPLVAGSNITITENTNDITLAATAYTAGDGVSISNQNVISAKVDGITIQVNSQTGELEAVSGGSVTEIFWVTPYVTTFSEIWAAVNAGKSPIIKVYDHDAYGDDWSLYMYCVLDDIQNHTTPSSAYAHFTRRSWADMTGNTHQDSFFRTEQYTVTGANTWSCTSRRGSLPNPTSAGLPAYSNGCVLTLVSTGSGMSYDDWYPEWKPAPVPTAGNMLSVNNGTLNVTTTAGITDIQQVAALPANPVSTVLYLIPET